MLINVQGYGGITGPFALPIDPDRTTILRGRSGAGKSTILLALVGALYGEAIDGGKYPTGAVRDPEKGAWVGVETGGETYLRNLRVARTRTDRKWRKDGKAVSIGTDEAFNELLPADLRDSTLATLIMVPMRWIDLSEGAGGGLALRTALDRLLPGPTASELLAQELPKHAPKTEKDAAALATKDRRTEAEAAGVVRAVRSQVDTARNDRALLTPVQIEALRLKLDQAEVANQAREEALDLHRAWDSDLRAFEARQAEIARYERQKAAEKEPTDPEPTDIEGIAEAVSVAQAHVDALTAAWNARVDQYAVDLAAYSARAKEIAAWQLRAEKVQKPAKSRPPASHIATADTVLTEAQGFVDRASGMRTESMERHADWTTDSRAYDLRILEIAAWDRMRAAIQEPTDAGCPGVLVGCQRVADARAAYDRQIAALPPRPERLEDPGEEPPIYVPEPSLAEAVAAARTRLDALRADEAAWARYDADLVLLGRCPNALEHPGDPPIRDDDAAGAAVALEAAQKAHRMALDLRDAWRDYRAAVSTVGDPPDPIAHPGDAPQVPEEVVVSDLPLTLHEAARERLSKAAADYEAAEVAHLEARDSVATAEKWLAAIRSAPARALAGKLALLGEGRLQVRDIDGKTAVEIDGRPWELASTGHRVAADAEWRVRLRKASGRDLPVFIDDVVSADSATLPSGGGIVWLVKDDAVDGLEVSHG